MSVKIMSKLRFYVYCKYTIAIANKHCLCFLLPNSAYNAESAKWIDKHSYNI